MEAKEFYNKKAELLCQISDRLNLLDDLIIQLRLLEKQAVDTDQDILDVTHEFSNHAVNFDYWVGDQYMAVAPLTE